LVERVDPLLAGDLYFPIPCQTIPRLRHLEETLASLVIRGVASHGATLVGVPLVVLYLFHCGKAPGAKKTPIQLK
jgi:hypothetical protein